MDHMLICATCPACKVRTNTTYVRIVQYIWRVERTMHCRILFSALLAVPLRGDSRGAHKGETLRLLKREKRVKASSLVPDISAAGPFASSFTIAFYN